MVTGKQANELKSGEKKEANEETAVQLHERGEEMEELASCSI